VIRRLRPIAKQLTCPGCGDVVADATYQPLSAKLRLVSVDGTAVLPTSGGVLLRSLRENPTADDDDLRAVERNLGELMYDIRCRRGHRAIRTAPQVVAAMRRAQGRWADLT
jgi:hypothetical protein